MLERQTYTKVIDFNEFYTLCYALMWQYSVLGKFYERSGANCMRSSTGSLCSSQNIIRLRLARHVVCTWEINLYILFVGIGHLEDLGVMGG
jgi:hypothetical protein